MCLLLVFERVEGVLELIEQISEVRKLSVFGFEGFVAVVELTLDVFHFSEEELIALSLLLELEIQSFTLLSLFSQLSLSLLVSLRRRRGRRRRGGERENGILSLLDKDDVDHVKHLGVKAVL